MDAIAYLVGVDGGGTKTLVRLSSPWDSKTLSLAARRPPKCAPAAMPPMNAARTALTAYAVAPNTYPRSLENATS